MQKIKTINSLMKYLREKKNIQITGSNQKTKLLSIGYYHGYKGYRFYGQQKKQFNIKNFSEIEALYTFDMNAKALFYPQIMNIETSLKNHVLQVIVEAGKSEKFSEIFDSVLNRHKDYPHNHTNYIDIQTNRLNLRSRLYKDLAEKYPYNNIVKHFYDKKDVTPPIWAIFEIMTLGEFDFLLRCINMNVRLQISKNLGFTISKDQNGLLLSLFVYLLKDLRNAIAHNCCIFDNRFKNGNVNHRIIKYLSSELNISDIDFNTLVDYVILVSYLLKICGVNRKEIIKFIKNFQVISNDFCRSVPIYIYGKIVNPNTTNKINQLLKSI